MNAWRGFQGVLVSVRLQRKLLTKILKVTIMSVPAKTNTTRKSVVITLWASLTKCQTITFPGMLHKQGNKSCPGTDVHVCVTNIHICEIAKKTQELHIEGKQCVSSGKVKTTITMWVSLTKYQIITFIMNVSDEWSPLTSSSPKYNITSMEYSSNKWHWNCDKMLEHVLKEQNNRGRLMQSWSQ